LKHGHEFSIRSVGRPPPPFNKGKTKTADKTTSAVWRSRHPVGSMTLRPRLAAGLPFRYIFIIAIHMKRLIPLQNYFYFHKNGILAQNYDFRSRNQKKTCKPGSSPHDVYTREGKKCKPHECRFHSGSHFSYRDIIAEKFWRCA
jgi:hypothetical protein